MKNCTQLIRQFFPKRKNLSEVTDEEIQGVMDKLNKHTRKCLGFKTPNQVLFGINQLYQVVFFRAGEFAGVKEQIVGSQVSSFTSQSCCLMRPFR